MYHIGILVYKIKKTKKKIIRIVGVTAKIRTKCLSNTHQTR